MKKTLTIGFFVLIGAYALFQARFLILGPRINIEEPVADSEIQAGVYSVRGTAKNISYISLNDRRIYTDTTGHFDEKVVAQKGINIIKLRALDRFGREAVETVRLAAN